ncbi:hypothetical protein Q7P37_000261 [Cladosporium fusiforme]
MPDDPRADIKSWRKLGKVITTLVVGRDEREFPVHQKRLCEHSPYFAAAAKDDWKEGQEGRIPLLCDSTLAVGLYVQWIYGGRIFTRPGRGGAEDKDKAPYSETSLLVEGFIFGEKIQDGDFRDAVVDAIIVSINDPGKDDLVRYPSGTTVERAYEGTPEGSPLRKLMVDIYVHHGNRDWLHKVANPDFLRDLAEDLYLGRDCSPNDPTALHLTGCRYHQHGNDRLCYTEIM